MLPHHVAWLAYASSYGDHFPGKGGKVKWIALPLAALGAALALSTLFLPNRAPMPVVKAYEELATARRGLPSTLNDVERIAGGEDAVAWQACLIAGRAHAAAGRFTLGAEFFGRALELRTSPAVQAERATLLEAAGDRNAAKTAWEKLLPRQDAVAAIQRLEADPYRLARLLVQAGQPSAALPLVTPPATDVARLTRARALAALGRASEAADEFAAVLATPLSDASIRVEYGRVLEKAGQASAAIEAYRSAGAAGAYREGLLLESLGSYREAADAYRRSSDSEALWRAGRLLEALGDAGAALGVYSLLASGTSRARDDAQLRIVQLLRSAGDPDAAARAADSLPPAFRWVLGSYTSVAFAPAQKPAPTSPVVRAADRLLKQVGFEWTVVEFDFALRSADTATKLAIGDWYVAHGAPRQAFLIGTPLFAASPSHDAARLAYPLGWMDIVERWSSAYGVDKYLVLAVIREESNYLTTAVSSSRALGLMQLLPSTGTWIAESKLGLRATGDAFFFDPETNIRLGTWYLSYLLGLFDGDVVRAVSAYNGGNGNVTRWTAAAGVTERADVPGALASTETREYLVKVLNSWLTYREIYAGGAAS